MVKALLWRVDLKFGYVAELLAAEVIISLQKVELWMYEPLIGRIPGDNDQVTVVMCVPAANERAAASIGQYEFSQALARLNLPGITEFIAHVQLMPAL